MEKIVEQGGRSRLRYYRVIRVSLVDNVRFKEKLEGNEDLSQMATWMKTIPGRWEYSSHGLTAGAVPGAAETGVAGGE